MTPSQISPISKFNSLIGGLSTADAEHWSNVCTAVALIAGFLLVIGLLGEYPDSRRWKQSWLYTIAKIAVIVGVLGELIGDAGIFKTSERLQQLTDESILKTVNVEKAMVQQLKGRGFTKEQFDGLVAALKGKIPEITVHTLTDTEAHFFGQAVMYAFQKAGTHVVWDRPTVETETFMVEGISSNGLELYVSQATPGFKEIVETFFNAFSKAGVTGLSGSTPEKPIPNVPSPSIFVAKHEVPFLQSPESLVPPDFKFPPPAWEPK
jgi:hypothetical protein